MRDVGIELVRRRHDIAGKATLGRMSLRMSDDDQRLGEELLALRAEVAALRAELAELREYIGDVPCMECGITSFEAWQKDKAGRD